MRTNRRRLSVGGVASAALLAWTAASAAVASSSAKGEPAPAPIRFEDVTERSGVDFRGPHSKDKKFILESVSGGVALIDYDRDGWLDLFLVGSLTVATADQPARGRSALYRNRGDGSFEDVTAKTGAGVEGWGVGVCAGDVDGDGWIDLYVTGVESNRLLRNLEGRRFEDATAQAGVAGGGWSTGCGFADPDRDGDLDLFVARYLDLSLDDLPTFGEGEICRYRDVPVQCGPRGLPGKGDLFFLNQGDGAFDEVGERVGLADERRLFGLGATWIDVDLDGWIDLYVANDTGPNSLYRNRGVDPASGLPRFEETAHFDGVAVTEDGKEQGSMGIAVGDYMNRGWPSLFVTNFSEEANALYESQEGEYFRDASFSSRIAAESLRRVGWGTAFLDADNDGWLDLVLVNGHVYPQMDTIRLEASAGYLQRALLFRNRRDGSFAEVPPADGSPLGALRASRGLAAGDIDRDGRIDLVVTDLDAETRILRNVTPDAGHWLLIDLVGRPPRRDALGAQLRIRSGTLEQTRFVLSGTSYLSQHPLRQHVGLGAATRVDEITVHWPDGSRSTHGPFKAGGLVTIEQPSPTEVDDGVVAQGEAP